MDKRKILFIASALLMSVATGAGQTTQITGIDPADNSEIHHDQDITVDVFLEVSTDSVLELYVDGSLVDTRDPIVSASSTESLTINTGPSDRGDQITFDTVLYERGGDGTVFSDPSPRTFTVLSDADVTSLSNLNPNDGATLSENTVTYEYSIAGKSGSVDITSDTCTQSGATIHTDSYAGSSSTTFSYDKTFPCSGTADWQVQYTGDDGSFTNTALDTFTIQQDQALLTTFDIRNPNDNDNLNGDINQEKTVSLEANIDAPEPGTVNFYIDGNNVGSDSSFATDTSTFASHDETLSTGSYNYYAEYVGDDGTSTQTNTVNFEIEDFADRSSLSITNPADGSSFTSNSVTFDYGNSAGGNGDVSLFVDGVQEDTNSYSSGNSESYSTTVSGLSSGSHSFFVQYDGDDGSTTQTTTRNFNIAESPTIVDTTFLNTNPQIGDPINLSLSFSDDSQLSSYDVTVDDPSGNQIASATGSISGTSATPEENNLFTPSVDGTYTASVTVTDSDGLSSSTDTSITVSNEPAPTFNIDSPVNNDQFQTALGQPTSDITFSGNINADFSGNTLLFIDGTQVASQTLSSGGDTYSFTQAVQRGSHTYTVKASSDASGVTYSSSTTNFDVVDQDQTPPISFNNWTFTGFQDQSSATVSISADDNNGVGVENISFRKNGGSLQTVQGNETTVSFVSEGNNTLEFFSTDSNGNVESTNIDYIAFQKQNSLSADLSVNNSNPKTGSTVEFDASGSTDSGGTITGYDWDLNNDGVFNDAVGAIITQSYADNGSRTVSVNVSSDSGFSSVVSETVNVQNRLPNASYSVSVDNLEVNVNASNSTDPDGSISSYQWDWTNDLTFDDSGKIASHNYSSDGNFNLKLTVTDDDGDTDTEIKTVTVSSGSSGTQPPSGGGGGGGDNEVDTTTVYFNSESNVEETVEVPYGQQVERDLFITNTQRREISVDVDRGNSDACELIQVQKNFEEEEFGESGSYQLPEATENFGTLETSVASTVRIDLPSRSVVEERGLTNATCSFDTSASYGQAEDLELTLDFNDSVLNQLLDLLESTVFEVPVANLSVDDPEVQDTVSIRLWMILALLLVALNVYLLRN